MPHGRRRLRCDQQQGTKDCEPHDEIRILETDFPLSGPSRFSIQPSLHVIFIHIEKNNVKLSSW